MINTIYLDNEFNFLLLECTQEENSESTTKIYLNIKTDATTGQRLEISVAGGAVVTENIASDTVVNFELSQEYWADENTTEITPKNDDITGTTITINFPKIFTTSAALNYISDTEFDIQAQNEAFAESGSSGSGSSGSGGAAFDFVETIRNIGFRLLDEPSNVNAYFDEAAEEMRIKWTDPADISTNEPAPATWAGTVVVRKEGSAPRHRWDGVEIVDSTTRDEYSATPLIDNTLDAGKSYYYGIFPYDTKGDYRFTKVVSFNAISTPRTTIIFESGNFNESAVMTDFEFENYKIAQGNPIPVDSLSEYYLTKWGLLLLDTNGRAYYQLSDVITCEYRGAGSQHLNSYYDIPIERIYNPQKVVIEAKFNQLSPGNYNLLSVRGYAIINGERLASNEVIVRSGTEYQEYETDLSGLPYLDYIEISAAEGQPYYKSIYVVSGG